MLRSLQESTINLRVQSAASCCVHAWLAILAAPIAHTKTHTHTASSFRRNIQRRSISKTILHRPPTRPLPCAAADRESISPRA
ncbi:hypothetical protein VTL71DRAFT_4912 [Oculimacula yallundae]|uniref:Secreted protein n=1 Tax=Oculimacula yallundae TaxID=86028 RepID=A0ABR4C5P9_9HELO